MNKIFKVCILILFVTFMAIFISERTGYTEYQNHKQAVLTKKQIKKFEEDVSKGKAVDVSKYLETNNRNYNNSLSKIGLKLSSNMQLGVKTIVVGSFKFLSKFTE